MTTNISKLLLAATIVATVLGSLALVLLPLLARLDSAVASIGGVR